MSLREEILEQEDTKEEIEADGHTLLISPLSVGDVDSFQKDLENPALKDMEVMLSCVIDHTYTEDGDQLFKEDDLSDLMKKDAKDPFIQDLLQEFSKVNELDMEIEE